MKWNWQRAHWPNFIYKNSELEIFEEQFLYQAGVSLGAIRHVKDPDRTRLRVELLCTEALKTSEIEGEILSRDSVQSSIRRHFGLSTKLGKVPPAEQGIAEMLTNLYETFSRPLSHKQLFNWHKALTQGRRDLEKKGGYRNHPEPMQIISGAMHHPKIHFEAPPSTHVRREMKGFIQWFNDTAPQGKNSLTPLTRAGIAHLYFVSIHPFEDGNGRIGRALVEKVLAQSLGQPTLISLSQTIEASRKKYYQKLEINNKEMEITDWLVYFAKTILKAQRTSQRLIDFLIEKTKFFDKLRGQLNPRQVKVLERMFREGPDGFKGGLSAENYLKINKASRATVTRDLQDLVEKEALYKTGELKHTRYFLKLSKSYNLY